MADLLQDCVFQKACSIPIDVLRKYISSTIFFYDKTPLPDPIHRLMSLARFVFYYRSNSAYCRYQNDLFAGSGPNKRPIIEIEQELQLYLNLMIGINEHVVRI